MSALSNKVKLSILAASAVSLTLIGALAIYLRRRRRRPRLYKDIIPRVSRELPQHENATRSYSYKQMRRPMKTPSNINGDIPQNSSSVVKASSRGDETQKRLGSSSLTASQFSVESDDTTTGTVVHMQESDTVIYTPEELCDLGLECVQSAISHWEEALKRIDSMEEIDNVDGVTEHLHSQLHELLQRAYRMQENFEARLFRQVSTTAALDAALEEMDKEWEENKRRSLRSIDTYESSDQESFVSALDMADLSDLEDQKESFQHLALYEAALEELTKGNVSCRTLRTEMVKCQSDSEFLAKLQCIRLAFQELFKDESVREWFVGMGKELISDLILKADRDPSDFQTAFDTMIEFVKNVDNWPKMEDELRGRGVKMVNFYDIVIDFILFDSFDDLDSPPSSVTTVIQNRWLSNGFKETALSTAVWSVLKAKRRMLKYSDGFIANFYNITEQISPLLAWGFLGTDDELKRLCLFFKDQVCEFMCDVFSFDKVRYTTVSHLSEDILSLIRQRQVQMGAVLSS